MVARVAKFAVRFEAANWAGLLGPAEDERRLGARAGRLLGDECQHASQPLLVQLAVAGAAEFTVSEEA
jgi:hypothetical protein